MAFPSRRTAPIRGNWRTPVSVPLPCGRGLCIYHSQVVDFDDITTGSGGYGTLLGEYQGKLWTALGPEQQAASNTIYQAAAITFFPAASSLNWLFTNPGECSAAQKGFLGNEIDSPLWLGRTGLLYWVRVPQAHRLIP